MILDEIKTKLQEIDSEVDYGAVKRSRRETVWNYTVFNRGPLKQNPNKTSYNQYYAIHIVRENFIPEGLVVEYINKMLEIAGMRLAGTDIQYTYTTKPNTDRIVEMASVEFVKPVKA